MGTAAANAGVLLVVGHLLVHHPAVAKLKELVDSGEPRPHPLPLHQPVNLGQVRSDENALWSLGAHDISVLLHLVGQKPESVAAQGQCFIHEGVEDIVFGTLRFPDGIIAHLHLSWLDPNKTRKVTIVGSESMAVFDDMNPDEKVKIFDKGVEHSGTGNGREPGSPLPTASTSSCVRATPMRRGSPARSRCGWRHAISRAACAARPRRCAGAEEGIAVIEILEALQRSLDAGGAVIPVDSLALRT